MKYVVCWSEIKMPKMTAYMKVYSSIKKKIKDGSYKPGMLLPTEPELEKIYGVSRITVRKAVSLLANEGYLNVIQGKGTEVRDISTTQRLNTVTSITETLKSRGYKMTVRGMAIEEIIPPEYVLEGLKLDKNTSVYCVQRVMCADDTPICIITNYLKKNLVPNLHKHLNSFVGLYSFIEETYGIVVTEAYEYVSAENAEFLESQILNIPMGTAVLCSRRIGYTVQGPFEYTINKLIGDRYEFSVHMVGRF